MFRRFRDWSLRQQPIGEGSGLGVGGRGRRGQPKTDEQRRAEHERRFGTRVLPPRTTGLYRAVFGKN